MHRLVLALISNAIVPTTAATVNGLAASELVSVDLAPWSLPLLGVC